jgi:hypothetical protein
MRPVIRQTFSIIGPIRDLSDLLVKTVNGNYALTEAKTRSSTLYYLLFNITTHIQSLYTNYWKIYTAQQYQNAI